MSLLFILCAPAPTVVSRCQTHAVWSWSCHYQLSLSTRWGAVSGDGRPMARRNEETLCASEQSGTLSSWKDSVDTTAEIKQNGIGCKMFVGYFSVQAWINAQLITFNLHNFGPSVRVNLSQWQLHIVCCRQKKARWIVYPVRSCLKSLTFWLC